MKLTYVGSMAGGIDLPSLGIVGWKPGEARDIPESMIEELLGRGDFERQEPSRKRGAEPIT